MAVDIATLSAVISITASIITTYCAYVIYKYNRLNRGWLIFTCGVTLAIFVRVLVLLRSNLLSGLSAETFSILNTTLLTIVSITAAIGLWSMKSSFETFEVVEKKTRTKIKLFKKHKKR